MLAQLRLLLRPRSGEPSRGGRLVALDPPTLLSSQARLLGSIISIVAVPPAHWDTLYRPMLEGYAGLVQRLPASEAHHHAGPGGLLRHGLEVACEALKLRRGALLPSGAPAEKLAKLQDLWTYTCVAAALLHDIGKPVVDQQVTLLDEFGRPNGIWSPLTGPIPVGAWYRVGFNHKRAYRRHERVAPLLARHVVPAEGLRWLASEPEVLDAWLAAIQGDMDEAGPLGAIVAQADGLSVARDLASGAAVRLPAAQARPLAQRLLAGLRHLLTDEALPLNRPGAAGFLVGNTLWVVSKRVLDALREHLILTGQTGLPSRNDRLMDEFQQHGLLVPNGDRAVWACEVRIGDWVQQLTCLRLEASRLWPDPERRPTPMQGMVTPVTDTEVATENTPGPQSEPALGSDLEPTGADAPAGTPRALNADRAYPLNPLPEAQAPHAGVPLPFEVHVATATGEVPEGRLEGAGVATYIGAQTQGSDATTPAGTEAGTDPGARFLDWLKRNITERRVEINTPKARLHVLPEGLALVSPGIFRDFDPARWQQAQKRFQKLRLHRKAPGDTNIWTCRVAKERKQSLIKVFLIAEPEVALGVQLPGPNPAVSLLVPTGGDGA